jgi:hypothetical protein
MLQTVPLAYKYVALVTTIAFVNHYAPLLNLPFAVPVKFQEIQQCSAVPPLIDPLASDPLRREKQIEVLRIQHPEWGNILCIYGAGIRINNYLISFPDGYNNSQISSFTPYFHITKLEDDGMASFGIPLQHARESSRSLMERASQMKYTVTTNGLLQMATNYLEALDIDPKAISKNQISIDLRPFHSTRGLVPNPLMEAYWGEASPLDAGDLLRNPGTNGVAFKISAVTGQLLEMCAGNTCGCKGLPLIKDFGELFAIPNEQFSKYSDMERSNLLARFAVCPSLITPEAMRLGMILTTNPITKTQFNKPKAFMIGQ